MTDAHGVTLYVPCYNSRHHIAEVMAAICAQDYPIQEIILVDDGCTDGSVDEGCRMASSRGRQLTVLRHERNLGLACARNTAIGACRTEFIAGVDSDVAPSPSWLGTLMREFERDPQLAGVGGALRERFIDTPGDHWRARHLRQSFDDALRNAPPFLFGANHIWRRHVVVELGGYHGRHRRSGEDWAMGHAVRAAGFRLKYVPEAQCEHLRRDSVWSALATFWRWKYYGNWTDDRSLWRVVRAIAGDAVAAAGLVAADLRKGEIQDLMIDLLYPVVSIVEHLSAWRAVRRDVAGVAASAGTGGGTNR